MYFVFDLDGTLVNLHSEFHFVLSLQKSVNYAKFVKKIAEIEASSNPLGILRPGILDVMEKLHKHKSNVMIYSNNGNIESLEFVKDVIHAHLKGDLIKKCIHLDHSLRSIVTKKNVYDKTWEELKYIIETFNTKVEPNEVYFFDDLEHKNLFNVNYVLVPEYKFNASFNRIAEIYKSITNDEKSIELFRSKSRIADVNDLSPPYPDIGIYLMMRTIDSALKKRRKEKKETKKKNKKTKKKRKI